MKENNFKILILDDEQSMCALIKNIVENFNFKAKTFISPHKALNALEKEKYDMALVDIKMPEMSGIDFLKKALEFDKEMPVVMITAYGSIDNAVECMKLGAFDFVTKPFQADEIKIIIDKIIERRNLIKENILLKQQIKESFIQQEIVGKSKKILEILEFAGKVANSKLKVLITGESGTGKELLARYIHFKSERRDKPFVPVQCSLLPETLFESELFGHKKGSFTGAIEDKEGLFEYANGGTLFLDEIGDITLNVQGKLLRFLQEQELRKVGDLKTKILDVKIISATNKNLEQLVNQKQFREDLYYRLKVITINLPPLRERKEDIPILVSYFVNNMSREMKQKITIDANCYDYLMNYEWPGNIRELKNCIENAILISDRGIVKLDNIKQILNSFPERKKVISNSIEQEINYKKAKQILLNDFEKEYLTALLKKTEGNITKAAKIAGIDKKNFWLKLKKNKIDFTKFK